ncbi:N-acetylmuramidase [bacterium]|nr:MAG: N-acetylmuramidase [bacterium]
MNEFERSLAKVLVHEGGWSNHPQDPGGATMKGVTQRVYDSYRSGKGLPARSVRIISEDELKDIYRARYWNLIKGDKLPPGISFVVFDGAVNSGVSQSAKWLQRALGLKADGLIGPATLGKVNDHPNHDALVDQILDQRFKFLKSLKTWPTFGKGWTRRVEDVRKTGRAWATGNAEPASPSPAVKIKPEDSAKAYVEDVQKAPSTVVGDTVAGAGLQGTIITQAINQLTPLASNEFVAKVLTWLTVASVLMGLAGLAYGFYARRRKAEVKDAISSEPT